MEEKLEKRMSLIVMSSVIISKASFFVRQPSNAYLSETRPWEGFENLGGNYVLKQAFLKATGKIIF